MTDDERLARFLGDAHAGAPEIPFVRVLAGARRTRAPRSRLVPRLAALGATALVLVAGLFALRTPVPSETAVKPPLAGWHAPTDFLLAASGDGAPTDFLLAPSSLTPDPLKGVPK